MILTVCVRIIILVLQVRNIYEICKIITMSNDYFKHFYESKRNHVLVTKMATTLTAFIR